MHTKFGLENLKEMDNSKDLSIDGRIIWILEINGLDSSGSGQGPVVGTCKHGNEPLGSIKGRYWLTDYYLLKKDSAPWSWLLLDSVSS